MTAISAQRASETPSPEHASHAAATAVRIARSAWTYEFGGVLRGMGLRWDPATRAWHGGLPTESRELLRRNYGLRPQPVVPIDTFVGFAREVGDAPNVAAAPPVHPRPPTGSRGPIRDYSRTRFDSRVALPGGDDGAEEFQTPARPTTKHSTAQRLRSQPG